MTNQNIYRNLGGLDPALVAKAAPAETEQPRRRSTWVKRASLAACLCLAVCAVLIVQVMYDPSPAWVTPPQIDNTKWPEGPYSEMCFDWPMYKSAKSLIDHADLVFIGKVTDISFQVLDMRTAQPVTETTPNSDRMLHTIYTLEIAQTYKGNTADVTKIRLMGGLVDYDVETQLKVMESGNAGKSYIPIMSGYQRVQCSIGNSYLFVLCQHGTEYPTIMNVSQSIFDLRYDPEVCYSGSADANGHSMISVKDIITEFGAKAWWTFRRQWRRGVYAPGAGD